MARLFKHKRKPRKETKSFSKNSEKTIYTYTDGSRTTQSHLNGKLHHYNKKGREVKSLKKRR